MPDDPAPLRRAIAPAAESRAAGQRPIAVERPLPEEEAAEAHRGFW